MVIPKLEIRGWYMKDRKNLPVWYVGEQLPQSLIRRKLENWLIVQNMQTKSDVADDEDDDYISSEKKHKVCFIS